MIFNASYRYQIHTQNENVDLIKVNARVKQKCMHFETNTAEFATEQYFYCFSLNKRYSR